MNLEDLVNEELTVMLTEAVNETRRLRDGIKASQHRCLWDPHLTIGDIIADLAALLEPTP